jgi:hypothetical protein
LFAPIAVDEDPSDDSDLGDEEESGPSAEAPNSSASIPPAETKIPSEPLSEPILAANSSSALESTGSFAAVQERTETLASAPAGEPEKTVDPFKAKTANDYSAFWVTTFPKLAELHKDIPGKHIKDMAKAAMAEAGNDTIRAYELLLQKIAAALPTT